ncbi:hypothetical protein [Mucilaginibacter sp. UYCu711]|uniref:hypothetical protein n=1 Tax=Mucilaginibacter sp. UYCu711 TaxID=3156339 RepID=UPI003D1C0D8B
MFKLNSFNKKNIAAWDLLFNGNLQNHNNLKRNLLICDIKINKMKQLWLADLVKARGIKITACERAIGKTNPVWKRLSLEPHKFNCAQVQGLAELLGMPPADLFKTILHFKMIADEEEKKADNLLAPFK